MFTPRSGSSWLTDVLSQTLLLGNPGEWFNPNFIPNIARAVNARGLDGYIEMLRRKKAAGGFFSFEITIYQKQRVFGDDERFLEHFPAQTDFFYLTRKDLILQAISLTKAVQTSVFHAAHSSADAIAKSDVEFAYDAAQISRWLDHLLDQECKCESFFARNSIVPHRLHYETMTTEGARITAQKFLERLRTGEANAVQIPKLSSAHKKIGTDRNVEYAARFLRDFPETLERIEAVRNASPRGLSSTDTLLGRLWPVRWFGR